MNELDPEKKPTGHDIIEARNRIKERIEEAMSTGLHLLDAARVCGVSQQLIVANIGSDPDFKRWWELSKDRPKVVDELLPEKKPADVLKKEGLDNILAGGLYQKLGIITALANAETEEGKKDLFKVADIAGKLMPSHSHQIQVKADMEQMKTQQEEAIIKEMKRVEQEMVEVMGERGAAEKARESYGSGSDGAEGEASQSAGDQEEST